ncbi:MAG: ZIP family metal transporter, partial [Bacteroidetes bacterium]|nr:ZIP family metal transporter [Bacteroidota bacterium]
MSYILLFISVLSGFLLAYLLRKKELKHIEVFMAFSGGFLLAITVFELLPPVFLELNKSAGIYIMIGILLQIFLEFLSKGAEHGHIHIHKNRKYFPWMLFLSLCIHAFIEGMPISDKNNLLWA